MYGHWVREVMCHLKLEKIRYTVSGATNKFYKIWQPFLLALFFYGGLAVKCVICMPSVWYYFWKLFYNWCWAVTLLIFHLKYHIQ